MALIVDTSESRTPEELEILERVGAERYPNRFNFPLEYSVYAIQVDADLIELMSPPLCFNCNATMDVERSGWNGTVHLEHACPRCGAREYSTRYPPTQDYTIVPAEGSNDEPD